MRRTFGLLAVTVALVSLALWWTRAGANRTDAALRPDAPPSTPVAPPLGAAAPALLPARSSVDASSPFYDPVVIGPCNLSPLYEQEVSSQVEGMLKEVTVDLGQRVGPNDVLARLDDRLLRPQVELLRIKAASESAYLIAQAQLSDVEKKLQTAQNLVAKRALSTEEYHAYVCQRDRYREECRRAQEEQSMAKRELEKAMHSLALHEIRSALGGEVTKVYKRSGEAVRTAEPLFAVARLDRLRVEGLCKVQQAALLRTGMRAVVEPEARGEQMTALSGHTGTITGLAVSRDGRLLASASEDQTVRLWSTPQLAPLTVLRHSAEVHAVAFGAMPGQADYRLLTGAADGQVRCWPLRAGVATEAIVWGRGHEAAVRAIACSPDGKWCATGGEDRRIGLWDTATGQILYWVHVNEEGLEYAHRGAVTSLQFTPDGHLISAGRDNTLKVWELGSDKATLVAVQPGRTGDAAHLGLSPDGRRVLFDHGEELRILDWTDGSSQGTLRSRRQGRFQGFATYSPSGRLILTTANNGQLQLWAAPALAEEGRFFRQGYEGGFRRDTLAGLLGLGQLTFPAALTTPAAASTGGEAVVPQLWRVDGYELRQFQNPSPAAVTCGAFAPDESAAYSAGADKLIHVWAVPPAAQWQQPAEAVITYVGNQVERGTDMVRVRAELDNPTDPARRLRPGTYAHLRLYPETARTK